MGVMTAEVNEVQEAPIDPTHHQSLWLGQDQGMIEEVNEVQ